MVIFRKQLEIAGEITTLFIRILRKVPQTKCWRRQEIFHFMVHIGIGSLPIIMLCTAVAGVVITKEIAYHLNLALHTVNVLPGFLGQVVLREIGIVIPAFLMVAKVGAATTAEVGNMKITEQIDALVLLGIDPLNYLVFPRFIAAIFSGICLTLIAAATTLFCSVLFATHAYNFSVGEFVIALRHFIGWKDLFCAVTKGITYSAVIPIISCAYAFRCENSAEGVGAATTQSVVTSTITIIFLDFLLTYFFTFLL